MIRAVIVDDSVTMRVLMRRALEADGEITVVDEYDNGYDAVRSAARTKPDIMTMDIMMPGMDGLEATRRIMLETPVPIIIVSSITSHEERSASYDAIQAGAVWAMTKPPSAHSAELEIWSENLRKIVKSMSEIKVISRFAKRESRTESAPAQYQDEWSEPPKIIAMAASTGGPNVLVGILKQLPEDYSIPILICQHISRGFGAGFAEWLHNTTKFPVRTCQKLQHINFGATLAPDSAHMEVVSKGRIGVAAEENGHLQVPSADILFESTARHYGSQAAGIILTGMGRDGCVGMGALWKTGALTIAQTRESSLVYGMPYAAKEQGYVRHEMSPDEIATLLRNFHYSASIKGKIEEGK